MLPPHCRAYDGIASGVSSLSVFVLGLEKILFRLLES